MMEQVNISTKLLKRLFKYVFVYENSRTIYDWDFDDKAGDIVETQKIEKKYYIDYTETSDEISSEEYEEFLRLEALLKKEDSQ